MMKEIKLKSLTLSNWRGQSREIVFSGTTEICGRNKSGKSTVMNAFLWLILGVDELDRMNYQLFDNKVEQTHENSKLASVEGTLDFYGVEYKLRKTAEIGWSRINGRTEYERRGTDKYKFYVDGVEKSATEYKKFLEEKFAPFDKLKIMLNIRYFLSLDWKAMRKHLEDMVGEITESDFSGDYSLISEDLKKYTMDELKEYYKKQLKPIKDNMLKLPEQIKALKATIPSEETVSELEHSIDVIKKKIEDIDAKMLCSPESLKKRDKQLEEINLLKTEYSELESDYNRDSVNRANEIKMAIEQVDLENKAIRKKNEMMEEQKKSEERNLANLTRMEELCKKKHEELLAKNKECKERVFTGDKCSYCGQTLPEDMLEEARKKFELQKDTDHKNIVSEGKINREKWNGILEEIKNSKKRISEDFNPSNLKDKTALEVELSSLRAKFVRFCDTKLGSSKLSEIKEKESKIENVQKTDNGELTSLKKKLTDEIVEVSKKIGTKDKILSDISRLEGELKDNSIESANIEGKLNSVIQYEREKAKIVYNRVNDKFSYAKVEMTDIDKSGNIVDTCRVLDADGVNASVTNYASYIRCCIDISTAFCKHYGISLPMFVDFAESITDDNFPSVDRQMIKLIVEKCDFVVR